MGDKSEAQKRWYRTNWGIVLLLVFLFPVGLYLMWRYASWNKNLKLKITGLFLLLGVIGGIVDILDGPDAVPLAPANRPSQVNTIVKATSTPEPAEKINIQVTSQVVKKVDGKYRYFFDIRNNDTKGFEGSVSISLITSQGKSMGGDTFNTNKPIEPELGSSQYVDIYTGPVSVHGENGISKFKFSAKNKKGQVVNEGEGEISSKLEDLDNLDW